MQSRCSNCGGPLAHGNALGACTRCGHALTGAHWELLPPSRRQRRTPHVALLVGGGAVIGLLIALASVALLDAGPPEPERVRVPNVTVSVGALAPAPPPAPPPAPVSSPASSGNSTRTPSAPRNSAPR